MSKDIVTKKVVFGGDSGVGKTSIIRKYVENEFSQFSSTPTVNVNFSSKEITVNDSTVKLQFWDTAGQEAYRSISVSYFRNAKGIVLVYDVTNPQTFLNLKDWIGMIEEKAGNIPWIIFGNKSDLMENAISEEEIASLAQDYGVNYFIGSAKDGVNIDEAFYNLTELMIERDQSGAIVETENVTVDVQKQEPQTKKCC